MNRAEIARAFDIVVARIKSLNDDDYDDLLELAKLLRHPDEEERTGAVDAIREILLFETYTVSRMT